MRLNYGLGLEKQAMVLMTTGGLSTDAEAGPLAPGEKNGLAKAWVGDGSLVRTGDPNTGAGWHTVLFKKSTVPSYSTPCVPLVCNRLRF